MAEIETGLVRLPSNTIARFMSEKVSILARMIRSWEQERLIKFALKHKEFFARLTARFHPLSLPLLQKHADLFLKQPLLTIMLNNKLIAPEAKLRFALDMDSSGKWNWRGISGVENFPWTAQLVEQHADRWQWRLMNLNPGLPWSSEFIRQFQRYLQWNWLSCNNMNGKWTPEMINEHAEHIDWKAFSKNTGLPWSPELIERYHDLWDWQALSYNTSIPWSLELYERFQDKANICLLAGNEAFPWTAELLERFENEFDKFCHIPWDKEPFMIGKYNKPVTGWYFLSLNYNIPWTQYLFDRYKPDFLKYRINFMGKLGATVPFRIYRKFLKTYEACREADLARNTSIKWTEKMIAKYIEQIGVLSCNRQINWTLDFLEKYEDEWLWFEDEKESLRWFYPDMETNPAVYAKAFKPYLTDEIIDDILQKIQEHG